MASLRTAPVALLFSLLAGMASCAVAQVYKWVDEKGVVNYGDKPPARGKPAQPLAESGGSVSVVPGMSREELERQRDRDMQQRMRELEREVDALRAREIARDNVAPYPVPADITYVPAYGYGGYYGYGSARRPLNPGSHPGSRPEHPIAKPTNRPFHTRNSPVEPVPATLPVRGARRG